MCAGSGDDVDGSEKRTKGGIICNSWKGCGRGVGWLGRNLDSGTGVPNRLHTGE